MTAARSRAAVEALTNPTVAQFVVAELAEHRARVEAEANGSLLVGPRMNVVAQHIAQLCEVHSLPQPGEATPQSTTPPGDHYPGGVA